MRDAASTSSALQVWNLLGFRPHTPVEVVELRYAETGGASITLRAAVLSPADAEAAVAVEARRTVSVTFGLEHAELAELFSLNGRPLALTAQEYRLLRYFVIHPNQLLSTEQLLAGAWPDALPTDLNALRTCLSRVRSRLGAAGPAMLETRRGAGYRFIPEPERPMPHQQANSKLPARFQQASSKVRANFVA